MSTAEFIGVKNVSGADKRQSFGGDMLAFAKDEIRVVSADVGHFLLSRVVYGAMDVPGVGPRTTAKAPFKRIPLHEALKFAKEPENKSIAAAKAEAKREEEIAARVKAELLKEGWKAPAPAEAPKADEKKGYSKSL